MLSQSILLTFPDRWVRVVCQRYLKHCGYRVQMASDGLECWHALTQQTPDVLILSQSILWGGPDGVLARMSDVPALHSVPVVLLADRLNGRVARPLSGSQVKECLPSPLRLGELSRAVSAATGRVPATVVEL